MRTIFSIFVFSLCMLFSCTQYTYALTEKDISFTFTPSFPAPNEDAAVTLNVPSSEILGGDIRWSVDNISVPEATNSKTLNYRTNALGNDTVIQARITGTDGSIVTKSVTVRPFRVDMVVSSDTSIPSFYRGRALPSGAGGTTVRSFVFDNTKQLSPSSLTYEWRLNGRIFNTDVTKSANSITFDPLFEKTSIVQVSVFDATGNKIAEKTTKIPTVSPEIYLYELNPLRGLSPVALFDEYVFVADEITLRAEPYFFEKEGGDLQNEWSIDSIEIENPLENPYVLTLEKQRTNGDTLVEFSQVNTKQFLQKADIRLNLTF